MTLLQIIALLGVAFGIALVASGRGKGLAAADPDRPPLVLPEQLSAADIDQISFSLGVRGYRMDEVDEVMAKLQQRIAELESEVSTLTTNERDESAH